MNHHSLHVAPGVYLPVKSSSSSITANTDNNNDGNSHVTDSNCNGSNSHPTSPLSPSILSYKQIAQETINIRSHSTNLARLKLSWSDETAPLPIKFLIIYKEQYSDSFELRNYLSNLCEWILNHSTISNQSIIYLSCGSLSDCRKESSSVSSFHSSLSLSSDHFNRILTFDCMKHSNIASASNPPEVDLIITIGGDGTILNAAWLYQQTVPPILAFHGGTLGFLTEFEPGDYERILENIFGLEGVLLCMRMRLECQFINGGRQKENILKEDGELLFESLIQKKIEKNQQKKNDNENNNENNDENEIESKNQRNENKEKENDQLKESLDSQALKSSSCTWQVLNELAIDKGSSFMASIDIYGDGRLLTTALADGLLIATPTGSTAYSMSAGGSLVHPQVPSILITPICSHTLSFRPFLLPDSISLELQINSQSRVKNLWVSFDGRGRMEMEMGDRIVVHASHYPVPTICRANQTIDWFRGLSQGLKWNERPMSKYI